MGKKVVDGKIKFMQSSQKLAIEKRIMCLPRNGESSRQGMIVNNNSGESRHSTKNYKTVRFSQDEDIIGSQPFMTNEERNDVWLNREDYNAMKKAANIISQEVRKMGKNSTGCIAQSLDTAYNKKVDICSENNLPDVTSYCNQKNLIKWCTFGHSRRGLEQRICKIYNETRKKEVRNLKHHVFSEQNRQSKHGFDSISLANVAKSISFGSCNFAIMMGEADAVAARNCYRVLF